MNTLSRAPSLGGLLREWRVHRRLSQLELALEANISTRHLSFLETGRAQPSRDMVLHLAEQLELPLRSRNALLSAAGFAPVFQERALEDLSMQSVRDAVETVLTGHEPYPALLMDRHWTLVTHNRAVGPLLEGLDPALLEPPINVVRLSLHPAGLAPRIVNLGQWRAHLLERLRRQLEVASDANLSELLLEVEAFEYPERRGNLLSAENASSGLLVPLMLETHQGVLSFLSTTMVFGTALDITLAELTLESFFPADPATAEFYRLQRTI